MASCGVLGGGDEVSDSFAASLANSLSAGFHTVQRKIFPDGESYVRIPHEILEYEEVCVVKSLGFPQDKSLVELLLIVDTLKEKGVNSIVVIAPYLAYSRQDREFLENESVSVRAVLRLIRRIGASSFYTVEIHKADSLKYFDGPAYSVSPYRYMARVIEVKGDEVVIAPDLGAYRRAKEFAEALGLQFDYLIKHRDRITGEVSFKPKHVNVDGRDVIMVDDIISTGGTIAKASRVLRGLGATSVSVVVAHALLVGDAWSKLIAAGVERVYAANTVKPSQGNPIIIDVAPMVAEAIESGRGRE